MKKILIVFGLLLLTGCANELVCTKETEEENYKSEVKVVFEFNGDEIKDSYAINTMTFNTKEEASSYFGIIESLGEGYNVTQKNEKQLEMKVSKNFDIYNNDKDLILEEFENDGYSCE